MGTNGMGRLRGLLVLGIIGFCIVEGVYVSIPDYCYDAPPWAIMLWGEQTQWWSEMTWLLLFGIFSISLIYVVEWSKGFKDKRIEFYQRVFRIIVLVAFLSLLWNFSAVYWHWDGWSDFIILDRGGWLHGIFYLGVSIEGLWLFGELIGLGCKVQGAVLSRIGHPE